MGNPTATTAPSPPRIGGAADRAGSGPACSDLKWIALFTDSVRRERVSASTLEAYSLDLAMLARWATSRGQDLLALSTADLTRYVAERVGQGTQLSTLARHRASFRRFYAFLISHGSLALNPAVALSLPQAPGIPSRPVRDEVLRVLLQSPPRRPQLARTSAYRVQRDHAIVCMLYGTELGISDVRLLRWQQIDEHRKRVRAPMRNGALRTYDLDPALIASLAAVREGWSSAGFEHAESSYCFPTASGLPMSRQALRHVVQRWAKERGQSGTVTPSALRQTGRAAQSRPRRPASAVAIVVG